MPVTMEVTNRHSRNAVKGILVELIQRVHFDCDGGSTRVCKTPVARIVKGDSCLDMCQLRVTTRL